MSDRESREYYRDYSRPPHGRDSHHRYYDDEYVVPDRHYRHPPDSNDNVSARRTNPSSRPRAPSMYDAPPRGHPDYDIEVVYDDEDSFLEHRDRRRSLSRSPPPQSARRSFARDDAFDVPPPPLGRDSGRDREWKRERDVVVDLDEHRHRSSPVSDRAKNEASMMVNPPTSVHPTHAGALVSRKNSPASGGRASAYEYGDRPDEYAYTRDDGVVVVRSQPQEIEIVEQVVPVPVRSKSRTRSKSGVRRKVSLDMTGADSPPPYKRLILACDGTWMNSDNGMANGELAVPSNVTRISRAIKPMSKDRIPQIVYYHFGVGSRGSVVNRVISGSTGNGLEENVREAYSFLSNNYSPGDEIFLIGFSRGAFTARCIAGLIEQVGVLTKKGLGAFVAIFEDVQHRRDRNYKDRNPDIPFSDKPNAGDPAYRRELEARGMTTLGVRVKAIGVWDTVGSLGVPRIGWLTKVGLQPMQSKEMAFFDTKLAKCVDYAFQALALDERRSSFAPALWEKGRDNARTVLRQVWFPGVHSNVGGGYDDQQLANITLAWMVAQLQPFLDFKVKYVFDQEAANDRFYARQQRKAGGGTGAAPPRPWSFGEISNSASGIYSLAGSARRTPGLYAATEPQTGRSTGRPLRETCEYVHASVRARWKLGGPGPEDKGGYDPDALEDWRLMVEYPASSDGRGDGDEDDEHGHDHDHDDRGGRGRGGRRRRHHSHPPDVFWRLRGSVADDRRVTVSTRVLPEAPLSRLERELLAERDPETFEYVMWPPPRTVRPKRTGGGGGGGARARSKSKSRGPARARERLSMIEPGELGDRDARDARREEDVVVVEERDGRRRRRRSVAGPPPAGHHEYRRSMPERLW